MEKNDILTGQLEPEALTGALREYLRIIEAAREQCDSKIESAHKSYLRAYWPWQNASNDFSDRYESKKDWLELFENTDKQVDLAVKFHDDTKSKLTALVDKVLGDFPNSVDLTLSLENGRGPDVGDHLKEMVQAASYAAITKIIEHGKGKKAQYYAEFRKAAEKEPQLRQLRREKDCAWKNFEQSKKQAEREFEQTVLKAQKELGIERTILAAFGLSK